MKPVFAVLGFKKSGKTSLIEAIVSDLSKKGYRVAVIKHIHHGDFKVDIEGKDTWRFMKAGAVSVSGISPNRLYINISLSTYPNLDNVIELMSKYSDIIILEGFKDLVGDRNDIYKIIVGNLIVEDHMYPSIISKYSGERDYGKVLHSILDVLSK